MESLESRTLLAAVPFSTQNVIIDGEFTAREPHAVFSVDLDGDGDADVLSASFADDKIAWYENLKNPLLPPQVVTVQVSGDGWPQRITLPDGSPQLDPLPLAAIDQVHLVFSEHVTVVQGDLELFGVDVPQYSFVSPGSGGFSYDAQTVTATWKLTAPIATDKLRLVLSDSVLAQIHHAPDHGPAFDASPACLAQPTSSPFPAPGGRNAREALFAIPEELLRPTDIAQNAVDSLLGSHSDPSPWARSTEHVPYRQEPKEEFPGRGHEWRYLRARFGPQMK